MNQGPNPPKLKYTIEFLLSFKDKPECQKRPINMRAIPGISDQEISQNYEDEDNKVNKKLNLRW